MISIIPWKRDKNLKTFPTSRMLEMLDEYKAKVYDHKKEMSNEKDNIIKYFEELHARAGTKDKEASRYFAKRGWDLE